MASFKTVVIICILLVYVKNGCFATINKLPLDYGLEFGDTLLPKGDTVQVPLNLQATPFHFIDDTFTNVYIDVDGAIWLGNWHCDEDCPIPLKFPVQPNKQMVACYWADADSSLNPNSAVYYRNSQDQLTWNKFNSYIQKGLGSQPKFDFTSTSKVMIVVTWIDTTYSGGNQGTPTNTFQCAIASDGINSYTIFSFGSLNWIQSPYQTTPAAVGVDDGSPSSSQSSLVMPQSWTAQVDTLVNFTNFKTQTMTGGPNGWSMVSECAPIIPPYYPIPPNTPIKHCYANGDPHYYTFDGQSVDSAFGNKPNGYPYPYVTSNQPAGNYILMATTNCKDTNWPPVSVVTEVENTAGAPPNPRPLGYITGVIVTLYWNTASIGTTQDAIVVEMRDNSLIIGTMKYTSYDCPPKLCANYTFSVNPYNGGFKLTSSFGLTVDYANSQVDVYLAYLDVLQGAVFGYCGNMNENSLDDNFCYNATMQNYANYQYCWPESYLAAHVSDWGQGWFDCPYNMQVYETRRNLIENIVEPTKFDSTIDTSNAEAICSVLIDPQGVFSMCQTLPTLQNLYDSCVADLSVMNGDQEMLCTYAQQTARECMAQQNLTSFNWRSPDFCPLQCPTNSHYSSGFSPCIATCDDPFAPAFCRDQNTEGCQCDNGTVYQNAVCVQQTMCGGCLDDQGNTVPIGGAWLTMDCSKTCTCGAKGVSCQAQSCNANAHCSASGSSATCVCNTNYAGDGIYCSNTDNCYPVNNCENGATCITQQAGYTCICPAGFTDNYCQTEIDYCAPENPCINNGQCINGRTGFTCNCTNGFTGSTCDLTVNWCASFPCQNLATCQYNLTNYSCTCPHGFSGPNCEYNSTVATTMAPTTKKVTTTMMPTTMIPTTVMPTTIMESTAMLTTSVKFSCDTFMCLNGGTCYTDNGVAFCECAAGYGGIHCEHQVDYCHPNPCVHGKCMNQVGGYMCQCDQGYTGTNCEQIDYCSSQPCLNGGTCENEDLAYVCNCAYGYTGVQCEEEITSTPYVSTLNPYDFNCTGLPNGNYPLSRTTCMSTYILCVNGLPYVEQCEKPDTDFDPVTYLCAWKCFIKACIDSSCYTSNVAY